MEAQGWVDRFAGTVSPSWGLRRMRARVATEMLKRNYEAASVGRRTDAWRRTLTDPNAAVGPSLSRLRDFSRDLVRNNAYAESALETIVDQTVGTGIVPTAEHSAWKTWSETREADADGRCDLYGLQKLIMRTVVESGEVLIRRRFRRLEDGLAIPLQLQVLEPDFLDTSKEEALRNGGRIVQGVEFDAIGRRVAYWLFREHPGSSGRSALFGRSIRVSGEDVLHIFKPGRAGQVRGPSWFAPVILRMKDFDEYEDATLMKQKIAACLAVFTTDVDGTSAPLGTTTTTAPEIDSIEPGWVGNLPAGRDVHVIQPPRVNEYRDYTQANLRAIAAGLGVTYEDLTGDYTNLPFSAARMSRIRHWARVEDWRWRIMVPQFLDPVWEWAMTAASLAGQQALGQTEWTAPAMPMIEPDKEGLAIQRNIRTGIQTLSEAIRERGFNPDVFLAELKSDFEKLDELGLVLDSDPRHMTQAGQFQSTPDGDDADRLARHLYGISGEEFRAVMSASPDAHMLLDGLRKNRDEERRAQRPENGAAG